MVDDAAVAEFFRTAVRGRDTTQSPDCMVLPTSGGEAGEGRVPQHSQGENGDIFQEYSFVFSMWSLASLSLSLSRSLFSSFSLCRLELFVAVPPRVCFDFWMLADIGPRTGECGRRKHHQRTRRP